MPNRVIKDSVWTSPTLAKLSQLADAYWDRFILVADDWGCFDAAPEVIKGTVFPRRKEVDIEVIEELLQEYNKNGLLFLWWEEDRRWGFFAKWDKHYYSGSTQYGSKGERIKHRRKTPEPPKDELKAYLKQSGTKWNDLEQSGTKGLKPKPNHKDIYSTFSHWIKKPNLIKHQKLTPDMIKVVRSTFKTYPISDLKSCVDSYNTVIGSDDYWYSYGGLSFETFFRKGVQKESPFKRFLPEAKPLENLLRDAKKPANKTFPEKKQSKVQSADDYLKSIGAGEYEKKK